MKNPFQNKIDIKNTFYEDEEVQIEVNLNFAEESQKKIKSNTEIPVNNRQNSNINQINMSNSMKNNRIDTYLKPLKPKTDSIKVFLLKIDTFLNENITFKRQFRVIETKEKEVLYKLYVYISKNKNYMNCLYRDLFNEKYISEFDEMRNIVLSHSSNVKDFTNKYLFPILNYDKDYSSSLVGIYDYSLLYNISGYKGISAISDTAIISYDQINLIKTPSFILYSTINNQNNNQERDDLLSNTESCLLITHSFSSSFSISSLELSYKNLNLEDLLSKTHKDSDKISYIEENKDNIGIKINNQIKLNTYKEYFTYISDVNRPKGVCRISNKNLSENSIIKALVEENVLFNVKVNFLKPYNRKDKEDKASNQKNQSFLKYIKNYISQDNQPKLYIHEVDSYDSKLLFSQDSNLILPEVHFNHGPGDILWYIVYDDDSNKKLINKYNQLPHVSQQSHSQSSYVLFSEDIKFCLNNNIKVYNFIQKEGECLIIKKNTFYWRRFINSFSLSSKWNIFPYDYFYISTFLSANENVLKKFYIPFVYNCFIDNYPLFEYRIFDALFEKFYEITKNDSHSLKVIENYVRTSGVSFCFIRYEGSMLIDNNKERLVVRNDTISFKSSIKYKDISMKCSICDIEIYNYFSLINNNHLKPYCIDCLINEIGKFKKTELKNMNFIIKYIYSDEEINEVISYSKKRLYNNENKKNHVNNINEIEEKSEKAHANSNINQETINNNDFSHVNNENPTFSFENSKKRLYEENSSSQDNDSNQISKLFTTFKSFTLLEKYDFLPLLSKKISNKQKKSIIFEENNSLFNEFLNKEDLSELVIMNKLCFSPKRENVNLGQMSYINNADYIRNEGSVYNSYIPYNDHGNSLSKHISNKNDYSNMENNDVDMDLDMNIYMNQNNIMINTTSMNIDNEIISSINDYSFNKTKENDIINAKRNLKELIQPFYKANEQSSKGFLILDKYIQKNNSNDYCLVDDETKKLFLKMDIYGVLNKIKCNNNTTLKEIKEKYSYILELK